MDTKLIEATLHKYKDIILTNSYQKVLIVPSLKTDSVQLKILLIALHKAKIEPFVNIPTADDAEFIAQQLWDIRRGWEPGSFVEGWDPSQNFTPKEREGIAKVAYALGFHVWSTEQGYYGTDDFLIGWKRLGPIFNSGEFEGYDPDDFTSCDWEYQELYRDSY